MIYWLPLASITAHPGTLHHGSWWTIEPSVVLGVVLFTALYLYAVGPLRRRFQLAERVERGQVVSFLLAMLFIFVSLQGPLHELSDYYLFSAHMLQHLLITLIMPPLLLKGIPEWLIDSGLRARFVLPIARFFTNPFIAFAAFNVVFALWHVPDFYQLTLQDHRFHVLEHVLFMATAVLTWWPVYSPSALLPRLNNPLQMMYLFFQSIIPTVLGALITFSTVSIYPFYAEAPRIALSVIDDQQIAGLTMWLGGAAIVLFVLTLRFFEWMELDVEEPLEVSHV